MGILLYVMLSMFFEFIYHIMDSFTFVKIFSTSFLVEVLARKFHEILAHSKFYKFPNSIIYIQHQVLFSQFFEIKNLVNLH